MSVPEPKRKTPGDRSRPEMGRNPAGAPMSPTDAAAALAPPIRAAAADTERNRRPSRELVGAIADAGLFRMCVPKSYGGGEVDPATLIRAIEAIAQADASTGWCVMIGATSGLVAAYLPDAAAREIYGRDPRVVTGGVFAPKGKALPEEGGYRVSGRWPFASGSEHCGWLMGGCAVFEQGKPRLLPRGIPESRLMLFPAAEAKITDTWRVSGMRGTGSHDIEVNDLLVPAERSVSLVSDRPVQSGPLYAFPVFGLLALGIAAVATGIARSAIDELVSLAGEKIPNTSRRRLAERAVTQLEVAQAEALLRSSRAFLFEAVADAWDGARREGVLDVRERAALRLAATHATTACARAVDLAYNAAGGTSIYEDSLLQRHFRDVHVVTQHMMVSSSTWELTGRIVLGVDTDTSML